jgi:hypothetical protein
MQRESYVVILRGLGVAMLLAGAVVIAAVALGLL